MIMSKLKSNEKGNTIIPDNHFRYHFTDTSSSSIEQRVFVICKLCFADVIENSHKMVV